MVFQLNAVVPWGRNMAEYVEMFELTSAELNRKIISFADGPASFNAEATRAGHDITSLDVVYQFSAAELEKRISETKEVVLEQTAKDAENYNWGKFKDVKGLEAVRMGAMENFLLDYEQGKDEGRYIFHEFPQQTNFQDDYFDLGLCSHFLFLYPSLGYSFHGETIEEMLRICKEVRISPLVDLDGVRPDFYKELVDGLKLKYEVTIHQTDYAFLKSENSCLSIKN